MQQSLFVHIYSCTTEYTAVGKVLRNVYSYFTLSHDITNVVCSLTWWRTIYKNIALKISWRHFGDTAIDLNRCTLCMLKRFSELCMSV